MKLSLIFVSLFLSTFAHASIGHVARLIGEGGKVLRSSGGVVLSENFPIELGDVISTHEAHVVLFLAPGTQLSLSRGTEIKITEHTLEEAKSVKKVFSVIDYVKGIVRAQVVREEKEEIDQTIRAKDVSFGVRGTEFEVSQLDDFVDLDVVEGEVTVSSPHVMSFVPEVVKAKEGFRFDRKRRKFLRRKFALKFRDHPGFFEMKELRMKRLEKKRSRRLERREKRGQRR
jgi:hypothetical protein